MSMQILTKKTSIFWSHLTKGGFLLCFIMIILIGFIRKLLQKKTYVTKVWQRYVKYNKMLPLGGAVERSETSDGYFSFTTTPLK